MSEREQVYEELDRTRRKLAKLKRECTHLRLSSSARENAVLRREASDYRKALSFILHRLDTSHISEDELREVVVSSLTSRGDKRQQRKVEKQRAQRRSRARARAVEQRGA